MMSLSAFAVALLLAGAPAASEPDAPTSPAAPMVTATPTAPAPAIQTATPQAATASTPTKTPVPVIPTATDGSAPVPAAPAPVISTPSILEPAPGATTAATPQDPDAIVVQARRKAPPEDPLQGLNIQTFAITQAVDQAFVKPVSMTYRKIIPDPARAGIRNFLNNVREPAGFLNCLLQFKFGRAARTLGRFTINTTLGVGGLFDIAKRKPFRLPYKPNGFANTFGYYGIKQGAFLFLPILGPTTVRDFIGDMLDRALVPAVAGRPFNRPTYVLISGTLSSVDQRAQFNEHLEKLHKDSDPYARTRQDYLETRQAAIDELHNRPHGPLAPTILDPRDPPVAQPQK